MPIGCRCLHRHLAFGHGPNGAGEFLGGGDYGPGNGTDVGRRLGRQLELGSIYQAFWVRIV